MKPRDRTGWNWEPDKSAKLATDQFIIDAVRRDARVLAMPSLGVSESATIGIEIPVKIPKNVETVRLQERPVEILWLPCSTNRHTLLP